MQWLLLALVLAVAPVLRATAEEVVVVAPTVEFVEWLDEEPKVSGAERLVGLRLGQPDSVHFDPARVRVALTPDGGHMCGRSVSRDGLYGSVMVFGDVAGGAVLARLQPFSLRFAERLAQYMADDLGVLVFRVAGDDCLDGERLLVPVIGKLDPGTLHLFAYANSGNRKTTATLESDGVRTSGTCTEVKGLRVGFDRICEIVLQPAETGIRAELHMDYDDFLAPERESYAVFLPRTPVPAGAP